MTPEETDALAALSPISKLLAAASNSVHLEERFTYLALSLLAVFHPALEPYREDPTRSLNGQFLSLDAQAAFLKAQTHPTVAPQESVGTVGAAIYLPGSHTAVACRVYVGYLPTNALPRWEDPVAVHPISTTLQKSASKSFQVALRTLLFLFPGERPPLPATVFWGISDLEETMRQTVAGDSLELPLALAFLSALTGLPISFSVGATGAVRVDGSLTAVGYGEEKQQAFLARWGSMSRFFTPREGTVVTDIAAQLGPLWRERFARASPEVFEVEGREQIYLWVEIENAPTYWEVCPGVFRTALQEYGILFNNVVARFGGTSVGDSQESKGAKFSKADDGIAAAIHLLSSVRSAIWDRELGETLPVRMGLHTATGETVDDAWKVVAIEQAKRIAGTVSAGQIFVSDAVHQKMTTTQEWIAYGPHRLRDFSEMVTLWQVVTPPLPRVQIPPISLETRQHNLPQISSLFVGRDTEQDVLLTHLKQERLLTLTGAGGVGKTHLAITVATRVLLARETNIRFADGVFFVALDTVPVNGEAILAAILEAVGVTSQSVLMSRRILLVLDNAESVHAVLPPLVQSLLDGSKQLAFLITSRKALRIHGEQRVTVLPLSLPKHSLGFSDWLQVPSVVLFMERAKSVDASFSLQQGREQDALNQLLQRLDGLPLAIELAVARVRYFGIVELNKRLTESLDLLSTRETGMPERHRTLWGTLEWSYDLLSDAEKSFLCQSSLFVGGFSFAAGEAMAPENTNVIDTIASLEEQSLIVCQRRETESNPRFYMLQTVNDFACAKLQESLEQKLQAQSQHASYFFALAATYGSKTITRSEEEADAFDILDREMGNLRVAWSYWNDLQDGGRLATFTANLSDFLRRRGHTAERNEWIPQALTHAIEATVAQRLRMAQALYLLETGKLEAADQTAQDVYEQVRQTESIAERAAVLRLQGTIATKRKQYDEAEGYFQEAESLYRILSDSQGMANVWTNRAVNAIRSGDNGQARLLLQNAYELCHSVGDERGEAYAANNLGHLLSEAGDYKASLPLFANQLAYCRRSRDTLGCGVSQFNIGEAMLNVTGCVGLPLLVIATEILTRLGHSYAEPARLETIQWANKTNTTQDTLRALRRTANRLSLSELRNYPLPELPEPI